MPSACRHGPKLDAIEARLSLQHGYRKPQPRDLQWTRRMAAIAAGLLGTWDAPRRNASSAPSSSTSRRARARKCEDGTALKKNMGVAVGCGRKDEGAARLEGTTRKADPLSRTLTPLGRSLALSQSRQQRIRGVNERPNGDFSDNGGHLAQERSVSPD